MTVVGYSVFFEAGWEEMKATGELSAGMVFWTRQN